MSLNCCPSFSFFCSGSSYALSSTANFLKLTLRALYGLGQRVSNFFLSFIQRLRSGNQQPSDIERLRAGATSRLLRVTIDIPQAPTVPFYSRNFYISPNLPLRDFLFEIINSNHPSFEFVRQNYGRAPQNFIFVLDLSLSPLDPDHQTGPMHLRIPLFWDEDRTSILDNDFSAPLTTLSGIETDVVTRFLYNDCVCTSAILQVHNVFNYTINGTNRAPIGLVGSPVRAAWMGAVARSILRRG